MKDKGLKKAIVLGAAAGAFITLVTALSLDVFFADTLHGTWRDAAVNDVTRMFGPAYGQDYFAVTLYLVCVVGFLVGFGVVLGAITGLLINRFFKLLMK